MFSPSPIIVVHRETRLEGMLNRWGTRGQAKFLIQRAAAVERARQAERAGAPVGARALSYRYPTRSTTTARWKTKTKSTAQPWLPWSAR